MGVDLLALSPYIAFAIVGILFTVIDIRTHRVPDRPLLIASGVIAATLIAATLGIGSVAHTDWSRLLTALLAAVTLFALYLVLGLLSPGSIGGGDAKFAAPVGAILGFTGWGTVLIGTLAAFLLVAFAAMLMLGMRQRRGGADPPPELPFVPFICAGAWIAIFWGEPIQFALGFV